MNWQRMFEFYFVQLPMTQHINQATLMCMGSGYVTESLKNHRHLALNYLTTVTSH